MISSSNSVAPVPIVLVPSFCWLHEVFQGTVCGAIAGLEVISMLKEKALAYEKMRHGNDG